MHGVLCALSFLLRWRVMAERSWYGVATVFSCSQD